MNIYFIRHGQKERVIGDPSLTEVGVKQAELTGEYLKSKDVRKIYSSPLNRTKQTAEIIGKILGLETVIDKRLTERLNWGDDPSQTFDDFIKEWGKTSEDPNYQPSSGDSSKTTGERMLFFLNSLKDLEGDIAVVTHGGAIADLLLNLFKLDYLKSIKEDFPESGIQECSITTIIKDNDKYALEDLDSTTHLPLPIK